MGEKTITTQVKIDGEIVPNFSQDWEVEFQGEKYIMPLRIPQGAKENTSLNSTIDLTFQHWAIYQLKRWPFVTIQQIAAGTYLPDEEEATVQLNLKDFCILFGQVLEYYYGDAITIDLNPAWQYDNAATLITISHTKIWNVLIDAFHDKYGVRWEIKTASDNSNTVKGGERYVIRVGYPTTEVDHIFEYGFDGGLLKVERQVQSEEIRNMLKGRGGETNIPFRYFKDIDPNNKDFRPDPDWVEELANIYFPNLMPATFRSYIQGWKAAHISKYPGYTAVGESNAYAPWAYHKGYTDTKFSPVEFVADEITINPTTGDKQVEILPGYSPYVKNGSSLDKYGPLPDTLDNNEDIYPTLQGTGLDIAVDVEQIESDDVAESTESDAQIEDKTYPDIIKRNIAQGHTTVADASKRTYFTVPTGKKANIEGYAGAKAYNPKNHEDKSNLIAELDYTIKVFNAVTGALHSASGIPAGDWYFTVEYSFNNTSPDALNVTLSFNSVKITSATPDDKWRNTFDIWVKNIWDSVRLAGETDSQYAERVWKPVLGDREGNEAKVVFTSGALAISEDYEFTIVDTPVPDTSKTWQEKNDSGVVIATHTSHWRMTLAKSEAELEATGLYVPSTKKQGKAGDRFAFIGTEMTHVPYVVDAEERLDDWKKDQLGEVKEIKPTFVVTTDRVRLNNEGRPDALINQLRVGNSIRLADKRFIAPLDNMSYETLYLQSITYTYRESSNDDAALNPDVEIVLGSEYATSANPVSMMQGEISALQRQVGAISNIEQIVRAVGDRLYLRKDGIPDRSLSPTQFFSLLTSGDFRAGMIGGAGWGFFKDENGNTVLEADRVNARQDMLVNTLVINQAEGRGGMEIDTAAFMTVTRVEDTDEGYVCYFDQKNGSVSNLFHIDDVAYCQRFTPENAELKFYKRRVVAVGVDSITLTKALTEDLRPADWPDSGVNGIGIPAAGDNVIHFGNYTDATRQYVKVRDVINGGYERYLDGLNGVNAQGDEYYFVGRQVGMYGDKPRWFIGERKTVENEDGTTSEVGEYAEYIDGKLNIKGRISIKSTVGDKTLGDLIDGYDASEYLRKALPQDTDITGGVVLSTLLSLGYKDDAGLRHTMAGMNGSWVNALNGRTIASWWGGSMLDLFKEDDTRKTLAELIEESGSDDPSAAASLVRMDGSAYFAKGNIGFRADGSGWLGNDLTGIKFSNSGAMTFGNGVKINLSDGSEEGIASTLESLLNFNTGLSNLLAPCDSAGSEIPWSEATQSDGAGGIKAKSLKAKLGLWSPAFLTAHGQTSNISGGGGGGASALSDLNDVLLSASLAAGDLLQYDGTHWVNISQNSLKPDLSGYATQEWVEGKGYALASALAAHAGDTSIHVSAADRAKWDKAASDLSSILGSDSDTIINKWEEVVAFLATYTEADTLANLLSNKADKTVVISAGAGLTGGGNLSANRTLALSASGVTAGTYTKVAVDAYGRVTAGTSLAASDIPALDITKVSGLQTALAAKLDKSVFDDLFEKVNIGTADVPKYAIRAKYGLYSNEFVAARGQSASIPGGGGGESYDRLDSWADYSTDKAGYVLSAGLGWDLNTRVKSLETGSALTIVETGGGNAVTSISKSGTVVTATKGATFLTAITKQMVENVLTGDITSHTHNLLSKPADNRSVVTTPNDYNGKFFFTGMKIRDAIAAPGTSTYVNGFGWRGWSDSSGGYAWEVFGDNSDLYVRCGATTSWGAWRKILTSGNFTSALDSRYVTTDTLQEISGKKTFTSDSVNLEALLMFKHDSASAGVYLAPTDNGGLRFSAHSNYTWTGDLGTLNQSGALTMKAFIKSGGTASQFLKADGSVDSNTYLPYVAFNGGLSPVAFDTGWGNGIGDAVAIWADDSGLCAFKFKKNNPSSGKMSLLIDGTVYINEGSDAVAAQSWVSSGYVKKSGDTMTGSLAIQEGRNLLLRPSNASYASGIGYDISGDECVGVWAKGAATRLRWNAGIDMSTMSMGSMMDITPDFEVSKASGTAIGYIAGNRIWHAGNDGAGSGLDADMLDGYHAEWFYKETVIDASALDQNTWYPVTIKLSAMYRYHFEIVVSLNSGTTPSWASHSKGFSVSVVWDTNGNDWGVLNISRRILNATYNWATTWPVGGITQLGNSSNEVIYVRGGGKYFFRSNRGVTPILRTTTYTASDQSVSPTTTQPAAPNVGEGIVAQRLNSRRTIWGQYFDGTGNVSGNMTGVGSITASGVIHSSVGVSSDGYVTARGQNSASDIRLKNYMEDVVFSIDQIADAPLWRFRWLRDGSIDVGSIAQYWQRLAPELARVLPDGVHLGLDYGKAALLASVSLAREHRDLAARVACLERENKQLKKNY